MSMPVDRGWAVPESETPRPRIARPAREMAVAGAIEARKGAGVANARRAGSNRPAPTAAGRPKAENIRQLLFEQMSSAVAIHEIIFDEAGKPIDYRFIDVNPAYEKLTSLRADQVVGKHALEVNPILGPELIERMGAVVVDGEPAAFERHDEKWNLDLLVCLSRVGPAWVMAVVEDVTGARRAEATVGERNAFIETIIASTGDGLVVYDRDLRILVWNPAMEQATGVTADRAVGRRPSEVLPRTEAAGDDEAIARIIETGEPHIGEFPLPGASTGRPGWGRAMYRARRDPVGEIVGAVASVRDITDKHVGEEAVRSQAQFIQELLDAIPTPIVAKDLDGRAVMCNIAYAQGNYGLPREDILGKTNRELGQPEATMHEAHDRSVMERGEPEDYEADRFLADGTVRRLIVTKAPLRSPDGVISGTVTASQDITERHAVQEALRRSEERFRTLFDFASDAIFIHDLRGKFVEVNRTACERLGYSREEFLTMSPAEIDAPDFAPLQSEREGALEGQGSAFFEAAHVRRDGTVVPVELSATIIDLGGRKAVLSIARDISERQRAEAERGALEDQLRQAQKMEGIGRLAGGIAHDFNNLLTAIRGSASLALLALPEGEGPREDLEQIEQAADRAASLTRQLLAFARRTVLQPEVVDLGEIVRHLEPMLGRLIGEDVTLVTATPGGASCVLADPGQIEQVIVNLAVNASDAMPNGGTLTIEVGNAESFEAANPADMPLSDGPVTILSVMDTGLGMDATILEHLFEPFFTTKGPGKGTGLGLATVYGIVRQSGGTVTVRSEKGHGSTFTIYLPRVVGPSGASAGPPRKAAAGGHRTGTILVVEDDTGVRRFASRVLETAGYRVMTASGGAAAIAEANIEGVHLLLTDVVMPGMSGREVASKLVARIPGLRVLYMSGHTDKGIVHDGVLEPDIEFLAKPFTADALLAAVEKALGDAASH